MAAWCVLVAAAGVSAGACSSAGPDEVDRAALANTLSNGFAVHTELDRLTERLARTCMRRKGFTVHPATGERSGRTRLPVKNPDVEIAMGVREIYNEEIVATAGYGRSPQEMLGGVAGPARRPEADAFDSLPAKEQDRYWVEYQGYAPSEAKASGAGDDAVVRLPNHEVFTLPDGATVSYPRQGCVAEVQRQLFDGKLREYYELEHYARDGLGKSAVGELRADPEVREKNRQWSECMSAKGHADLREPVDARNRASSAYGAEVYGPDHPGFASLKAKEIALATADHACNREVGLDPVRVQVFWRNLAQFYGERESQIIAWQEMVTAARTRGQQLLGG